MVAALFVPVLSCLRLIRDVELLPRGIEVKVQRYKALDAMKHMDRIGDGQRSQCIGGQIASVILRNANRAGNAWEVEREWGQDGKLIVLRATLVRGRA